MPASMSIMCRCGKCALEVTDPPIMTVECRCDSCREAGKMMEELPGAPPLVDDNGATRLVLYRKDRVRCLRGSEMLGGFRLKAESKTRRVVATCCNSPMLLDFTSGHWIDIYARRWPDGVGPPSQTPPMTNRSPRFLAKLIGAWVAMRFRTPKIDFVKGEIDALAR